jgi:hypothetical protein
MRLITPERVLQSIRGIMNGEIGARQDLVQLTTSARL